MSKRVYPDATPKKLIQLTDWIGQGEAIETVRGKMRGWDWLERERARIERNPARISYIKRRGLERALYVDGIEIEETERYTIQEVADKLKVHPQTVRRWIRLGMLKFETFGKGIRITSVSLYRFKEKSQSQRHQNE